MAEDAWLGSKDGLDLVCSALEEASGLNPHSHAPRARPEPGDIWLHANGSADTAQQSSPGCGVTQWDMEVQQVEQVSPEQQTCC